MSLLLYLTKASLAIILFYLVYVLVFKRLTFFVHNRFYLLGSLLFSLVLPFIQLPESRMDGQFFSIAPVIPWDQLKAAAPPGPPDAAIPGSQTTIFQALLLLYFLVCILRLIQVALRFTSTKRAFSGGTLVKEEGISWNIHPEVKSPFTLFRTIYLDQRLYHDRISPVRLHEEVHARQLHSIDLFITEIICAFLWFNPFVFLFKRQIRENHEFLADYYAQAGGDGLVRYMQAFSVELTRNFDPAFASQFRSSTIKKRIIMLTNKRSQKIKKWYYVLALPLIGLSIMAFQQPAEMILPETVGISVRTAKTVPVPQASEKGIPSLFPLEERYRDGVTFKFDAHAKHPITGEMMTHRGIDFRAPVGAPVYATADGTVTISEEHDKYGKYILIDHGSSYATLYGHMDALQVSAREIVTRGQQIGTVGNTGVSTGPHLHYEVRKNGEHVDPTDYF